MLVWCYTRVKLGRELLNSCQPCVDEKKKNLKRIQKQEEGQVPGGKDWMIDGKKLRVTWREFQKAEGTIS